MSRVHGRFPLPLLLTALLSSLLGSGCARNADLELNLTLPPLPEGASTMYAHVQVERGEADFESDWAGTSDRDGERLTAEPMTVTYSILTEDIMSPLLVKVRFCTLPRCAGEPDAPHRWYRFERAFHRGRITRWSTTIASVPGADPCRVVEVGRCEVQGCVDVSPDDRPISFCRPDGSHFCESAVGGARVDAPRRFDGGSCSSDQPILTDSGTPDAPTGDR